MRSLGKRGGEKSKDMSTLKIIPCVALARMPFWAGSYLIDVIKNKLQPVGFCDILDIAELGRRLPVADNRIGFEASESDCPGHWRGIR